jgi:hypothetical protein
MRLFELNVFAVRVECFSFVGNSNQLIIIITPESGTQPTPSAALLSLRSGELLLINIIYFGAAGFGLVAEPGSRRLIRSRVRLRL